MESNQVLHSSARPPAGGNERLLIASIDVADDNRPFWQLFRWRLMMGPKVAEPSPPAELEVQTASLVCLLAL